ncbi:sigma-70 family RNA polymerase sigma factor [Mesonia sp. MT50]|uniref:Sigma-70 family RNA polymerase sigma factor n=1 Tax=Mesonia profundi TaxID=3070998 RepID=A0ABU1A4F2_9FLAO|nr:sigma-70 family RNA polymerase sigma factor [Mesonia profundi]MDQ7918541.1 sigma-70 family RNA polymerase sigma factor [Mesonia profundi]
MNQKLFLEFVNPIKDKIYRLSLRLLVSKDAAEDATQEVMIRLWNMKDKLEDYRSPQALAMTITKNYCFDQLKAKKNNNLRIIHSNYEDGNKTSLQKEIEAKDELLKVKEIIKNLTEQEQMLIQLRDIEQLEYEEMVEITQMNPTAIRVALSRARKKIRKEILKKHNYGIA